MHWASGPLPLRSPLSAAAAFAYKEPIRGCRQIGAFVTSIGHGAPLMALCLPAEEGTGSPNHSHRSPHQPHPHNLHLPPRDQPGKVAAGGRCAAGLISSVPNRLVASRGDFPLYEDPDESVGEADASRCREPATCFMPDPVPSGRKGS
jgi:hypothetical protein